MRIITYIILVIILLLGISFAVLNADPVAINYYIGKHSVPLSLLLVFSFAVGGIFGLAVGLFMYFKQKTRNFRLKSRIKLAEKELENLRTIPLKDNR